LELTRREMELLQLIAEGKTLPQLADKMCLGVQTIRSYRKNLNIKLSAHNTAQLLQNAKALKLV
jgi:DNA-binding CsgD family transcriptional regulator